MAEIHNLLDDMGWVCGTSECGSVKFNLLRSGKIECAKCGNRFGVWEHDANFSEASAEQIYEETYRRNVMLATENKMLRDALAERLDSSQIGHLSIEELNSIQAELNAWLQDALERKAAHGQRT